MSQIVAFCGGNQREVNDLISAYQDMERHYRPLLSDDGSFDATRFSAFVELQSNRIRQALVEARYTKDDFAQWVVDELFNPINTVRSLPRILQNPKSKQVFLRDGAREAIKVLDVPTADQALGDATLAQLVTETNRRLLTMQYAEVIKLRSDGGAQERGDLLDLKDQLVQLSSDLESNV